MAPIIYKLKQPLLSEHTFSYIILAILIIEAWTLLSFKLIKFKEGKSRKDITRKTLIRFFFLFISYLLSAAIILFIFQVVMCSIHGYNFLPYTISFIQNSIGQLKNLSIPMFILLVSVLYGQWQYALKRLYMISEQNLIFQNETLKNQVNPHFLFNSLNTLLSLVNTNSENVEKFILKLSSIYRYIVENTTKDKISLNLELAFINDFFYLHKIRDEEKIQLDINIYEADKYEIMPVSLQLLIENALKHNMATRESPLKIAVYIEDYYVVVKNNLQKMASKHMSSKIGLKNLRERVRLITHKALVIEETPYEYIVKIPLIQ
jgi:sensor histidine kinase YesM